MKAGRRTYFLDVRTTHADECFLTITESKKRIRANGTATYDRHKIYLYKEDLGKFSEGLCEVIAFIQEQNPQFLESKENLVAKPEQVEV